MQADLTPSAFLSLIPPAINVTTFFFSTKLIACGIFHGHETPYIFLFNFIIYN